MRVYVGTSGYDYKEWKGAFYPEDTPAKGMLRAYGERLETVEINNTFYHLPTENVLKSWAEQVPADFVFSLKASRRITHIKRLRNVESESEYLFRTLSLLGERLGPVLFQFPATFKVDPLRLASFLDLIPEGPLCAFAFRDPSGLADEVLDLLRGKGCSLCLEDTEEAPVEKIISTASWGYLRLRRTDYTEADLRQWANRVLSQEWEQAFVYLKHEEEATSALNALRFRELVREVELAA